MNEEGKMSRKTTRQAKPALKPPVLAAVKLPELPCRVNQKSLYFLSELAFPQAPLLAFDLSILPTLCLLFLPDSSLGTRAFLADRVLEASSDQVRPIPVEFTYVIQ